MNTERIRELARGIRDFGDHGAIEPAIDELLDLILDEPTTPMRYAILRAEAGRQDQIARYMPGNYEVLARTAIGASNNVYFLIGGRDVAGWTLDGYVIPRLASGMYFAEEIA